MVRQRQVCNSIFNKLQIRIESEFSRQYLVFIIKQECIPVGCILPYSVATARCQHWGCTFLRGCILLGSVPCLGCTLLGMYLLGVCLLGGVPSRKCTRHTPQEDLEPGTPTHPKGTRDQAYSPPPQMEPRTRHTQSL